MDQDNITPEQCLKSQRLPQSRSHPLLFSESKIKLHAVEQRSCKISFLSTVPKLSYTHPLNVKSFMEKRNQYWSTGFKLYRPVREIEVSHPVGSEEGYRSFLHLTFLALLFFSHGWPWNYHVYKKSWFFF